MTITYELRLFDVRPVNDSYLKTYDFKVFVTTDQPLPRVHEGLSFSGGVRAPRLYRVFDVVHQSLLSIDDMVTENSGRSTVNTLSPIVYAALPGNEFNGNS